MKLSLEIEKLKSEKKCSDNETCDVNLILGFGEPIYGQGWMIIYRVPTAGSDVYDFDGYEEHLALRAIHP